MGFGFLLVASVAAFLAGDHTIKVVLGAAAISILFFLLIYYQIRFYREGDIKHARRHRKLPQAESTTAPGYLKSPHHRAIWETMDQTRHLIRNKEREFLQARMMLEKQSIRLPQEEEIVFMADRSCSYLWPVALLSLTFLLMGATPFRHFASEFSFVYLIFGLMGLLVLSATNSPSRYYMTNFRVLIRKRCPWKKEQWSAMNYKKISSFSRIKKLASEQLTLKSKDGAIKITGLPKHKLETILGILHQNCALK